MPFVDKKYPAWWYETKTEGEMRGPSMLTLFYLAAPFIALLRLHGSDFFSRKWGKMDYDQVGGFRKFLHFVLSAAHLVLLLIFYLR